MANPFAVTNRPPTSMAMEMNSSKPDMITNLRNKFKMEKADLESMASSLRNRSKEIELHFTSNRARYGQVAGGIAGGYSYGMYSNFVLKTLCNGDASHMLYKYRVAIPILLLLFGDKIVGKSISREPWYASMLSGMLAVAASEYSQDQKKSLKTDSKPSGKAPDPFEQGHTSHGVEGAADDLYTITGSHALADLASDGVMSPEMIREIMQAFSQSANRGAKVATEALEGLLEGNDIVSGRRARLDKKQQAKADKALVDIEAKYGTPSELLRLRKENEALRNRPSSPIVINRRGSVNSEEEAIEESI